MTRKIHYTLDEVKDTIKVAGSEKVMAYIEKRQITIRPYWNDKQITNHISERIYYSGAIRSLVELF